MGKYAFSKAGKKMMFAVGRCVAHVLRLPRAPEELGAPSIPVYVRAANSCRRLQMRPTTSDDKVMGEEKRKKNGKVSGAYINE